MPADELLQLTERLLRAIASGDWATYEELCDPTLTAFEPEGQGHMIEGMAFHRFYFDLPKAAAGGSLTTLAQPRVRMLGDDAAVVSYVRLVQRADSAGHASTAAFEETRVWHRTSGRWRHVHFHRSPAPLHAS